jgi:hypothetical protein
MFLQSATSSSEQRLKKLLVTYNIAKQDKVYSYSEFVDHCTVDIDQAVS